MRIILARIGNSETVKYTVNELFRILRVMDPGAFVDLMAYDCVADIPKNAIAVGIDGSVAPSELDDSIKINVKDGAGIITGANERAVLIAAYRFLKELGCRWLRPGADNEMIPKKTLTRELLNVSVEETPFTRYRGIDMGVSWSVHNLDMIEWLPRIGMNCVFNETFGMENGYKRCHNHLYNYLADKEEFDHIADTPHALKPTHEEIKRRGLLLMGCGHGFTWLPFGLSYPITEEQKANLTDETKRHMALVNGVRDVDPKGTAFTQLCYSNPETRRIMIDYIVNYCLAHPEFYAIHVWLGDGMNNFCECDECRKMRPSDYYIVLLNELDEALRAAGCNMKIVFLIYVDLLWEPEKMKLNNTDRFILMFAPISRTYSFALCDRDKEKPVELPPYKVNENIMPKAVEENIERLKLWQKLFDKNDSFVFDYHMMWDHILDPGYMECARILHRDMTHLDEINLNGMISCQLTTATFPTGLPNYAMAEGLWNKDKPFEEISRDYFASAFGGLGEEVEKYLKKISELFDPTFMRNANPAALPSAYERSEKIIALTRKFETEYLANNKDVNRSWQLLYLHAEYCRLYAEVIKAYSKNDHDEIKIRSKNFAHYVFENEAMLHHVLNIEYFYEIFPRWLKRAFSTVIGTEVDF